MRKRKRFFLLVCAIFVMAGVFTFFGEKGILHLLRLQKERMRIEESNRRMEVENEKLKEEARRLRYDRRYIEEIARKELGMVKGGEIIYQFDPPKEGGEPAK